MAEVNPFVEFVAARLKLDPTKLPDASLVNEAGNTFGSICVRLGALTVFQIEEIIERQREQRQRRFGEIAIDLGHLTPGQVDRLLALQSFYRSFEAATLLVLAGHLELPRLIGFWAEFNASRTKSPAAGR